MRIWSCFLVWLIALPCAAAPTSLTLLPAGEGDNWQARYSQAVLLRAQLTSAAGEPVPGQRVAFSVAPPGEAPEFRVDDPVTDATGVATARLVLVDGAHGGQRFTAAAPTPTTLGAAYEIRAVFAGDLNLADCVADAGTADAGPGGLCGSEATGVLSVALETSTLVLEPGNEVRLGENIDLIATLTDETGDAPASGTAIDGSAPRPLAGRNISFYYDLDGNARPSADERIGSAETNGAGVAVLSFFADPAFVRAQNIEAGLHAQFGGDDQYQLSGAQQALLVEPGDADATATLLEATPAELPGDGYSLATIDATLVDAYGNLLGVDAPLYDVAFTTSLGTLQGEVSRDPLTGHYLQSVKAPRESGEARIDVFVNEVSGPSTSIRFLREGCRCVSSTPSSPPLILPLLAVALLSLRRRSFRG